MLLYEEIKQVHVEPSQKCQASCPMCDRNKNGGEVNQYLTNADLSLEDVKKIFPKPFVKQLHNMYFCGNHGDPIFCPELYEICKWLKEVNPSISLSITTNGGARGVAWWTKIAKVVNQVIFSVDGLEDTNHLYRQGVAWKNVEANMEAFCDAGGKAIWTFLVFRHNEHQVEEARGWAKMIGVQEFIVKKSGRYISTATLEKKKTHQAIDRWGVDTKLLEQPISIGYQNKASSQYDNVVAKFGSMDNYLDVANINCKAVPKKEIYVSAEGYVFPCCWTAGQMYKWWHKPKEAQIWEHIDKYNISAKEVPLREIINNFFKSIEDTWEIEGCANGRLKVCALKCNEQFDPFSAQWT